MPSNSNQDRSGTRTHSYTRNMVTPTVNIKSAVSGMWCRAFWYTITNISEENVASDVTTLKMKKAFSSGTLSTSTALHDYSIHWEWGSFETLRVIYQTTRRYIPQLWSFMYSRWGLLCCCSTHSRQAWVMLALYPPSHDGCSLTLWRRDFL